MNDSDPANRSEDPQEHATQEMSVEASRSPLRMVPGDTIGVFKIIRILGEGGFGVVYLAEQTSPVKRRVALKVIKPGMDTKSVIARFEAERQALAMMDFPGIAKVFEAGATPEGRPYFAMEFVKGEPINTYCDRHTLDTRARLELFARVCDAIQHAHQKGVIHRDLKPGNILVTIDARDEPQPKVIDFGIAKATAQPLTEKTLFTEQGQLIGTPEYMSPEQAEMSAVDVDTRSDVYSLGVILYELLSGRLPFDPKTLRSKGFAEIQRIIREEDPPKPSTKLTTTASEEGTRIADARKTKLAELQSTLRRELEWIPLKALRKERTERYSSAEDLADDVRRYLVGKPLEAGPESASYRFKKLVRRNKGPFIAAALIALALIGGIIGTTIFAVRAAEQARIAEQRSEELQQVADFQSEQLAGIDVSAMGWSLRGKMLEELELAPTDVAGADFTGAALKLLNEHVFEGTHTAINEQFADQPLVRAQLLQSLAMTLRELGLLEEAVDPQETALHLRREHLGDEDPNTLASINNMGALLSHQGKYDEALPYHTEALEGRRRVLGDEHPATLISINAMGYLLRKQGKYDEALVYYTEALEGNRRVLGDEHPSTLGSISKMGVLLRDQGKYDDALPYYTDSLEGRRRVLGDEHSDTLASINNMGSLLINQGKYDEALGYYTEALEGYRHNLGEEHPHTLTSLFSMGFLLKIQGKYDDALPYYTEALETRRSVLGDEHPNTLNSISDMGELLERKGKYGEAFLYYTEALETRRRVLGDEHPKTLVSINNMGFLLKKQGKYDEALPYYNEALEGRRRVLGDEHPATLISINNMGYFLQSQGKYDEAEPYLTETLEGRRRVLGDEHPNTLSSIYNMGFLLKKQGKYDEAEPYFVECLETRRSDLGDKHSKTISSIKAMINLYDAWHEADPDAGHDVTAAEYRALLEELKAADD